ncbi:ATP-binding cassette domain-containing protein [Weeksellaceae bacterium KMM 9713]|uniref:Cell division ATP-binding protein FtsE n=1 Tax=Profundicola chukchiensis TaxID=2961959 RepID=A0A9X4N1E4_9FLAO|nr:ATP-binding cassette domain-containing protein [Profundicola chukchiensis]MDG4946886.1 ATP-binding cassette domain-containing protein [Profundicola chukchiensis]
MPNTPIISLRDADVYQRNFLVLNNVDFEMQAGEFAYLIGKTGSGKSSLLKILYGDLPLQNGAGQVAGIDLENLSTSKIPHLRRKLGIVFQDFQLLTDRTIEKNLEFVLRATGWKNKSEITHRIDQVLEDVNMATKKHKMPHQLSGGEQQRIAVARALLNQPQLILADEPTGNLDPETSIEIMNLIKRLSEENNMAVLMATHDYSMIRRFPAKTFRCENGKVLVAESQSLFANI